MAGNCFRASICLWLCSLHASAQGIITTFAGTNWIFPGNGRPAAAAPLGHVERIAIGRDGTLYIADPDNNMVFKVSNGILAIVAGRGSAGFSGDNGPAIAAELSEPASVTVDAAGNIYIADRANRRIRKVTAGTISTVAGTGAYGFNGDNIPANTASLATPSDVAADSVGNLYIADLDNNRIRKVTPSTGIVTTVAGTGVKGFSGDGGKPTAAMLDSPAGVFIDAKDQLFIADTNNDRIRRVGTDGLIQTVAGNGQFVSFVEGIRATDDRLSSPSAVTVDAAGIIYIANTGDSRVFKVSVDGIITTVAGTGNAGFTDGIDATKADLDRPRSVAVDSRSNVYIADTLNSRVRVVSTAGIIATTAGNGAFKFGGDGGPAQLGFLNRPMDVVIDRKGNIYISDTANNRVRKIDSTGILSTFAGDGYGRYSGDGGPAIQASLHDPMGLAVDASGNLLIADYSNNRVRMVDLNGMITTVAGGGTLNEGRATDVALDKPEYLALDQAGNIYLTQIGSFRARKITPAGVFSTFAGNGSADSTGDGGPAINAGIGYSGGIAVDSKNNVYLAEIYNGRVRKVTPSGQISTYAGTTGSCCTGDGGQAVNATLDSLGLAFDASDVLYIGGASRVRKVVPSGIISTVAGGGSAADGSIGDGGSSLAAALSGASGVRVDASGDIYIADTVHDRIRLVLNVPPDFQVAPARLTFSAKSGGQLTVEQGVVVTSAVTNLTFNVTTATSSGGQSWLTARPRSGVMPSVVLVDADPTDLPPGDYEGTVSINAPNSLSPLQNVTVKFSVAPADNPSLTAEPGSLSFDFAAGLPADSRGLLVRNNGSGKLPFTVSATTTTGGDWLSVAPSSGTVTAAAPAMIAVRADPKDLAPGTYAGLITVSSEQSPKPILIPVAMTVHASTQTIVLSQSGVTFFAVSGTAAMLHSIVSVLNPGLGTLNWSASSEVLPAGTHWLSVAPATGASGPNRTSPGQVTLTVSPAGLPAGVYYGRVTISSPDAANSPQVVLVVLTIAASGTPSVPDIEPAGLVFVGFRNGQSVPQQVSVTNSGDTSNSFRSTRAADSGDLFFTHQPTEATLPAGQVAAISVQPNLQGIAPGVRRGSITLQFADGSTRGVAVLLVVPNSSAAVAQERQSNSPLAECQATSLNLVFTILPQGFQVPASFPAAVEVKVVDDCGVFLDSGRVAVSFSNGDPPISLIPIGGGIWTGTWQPGTIAGQVRLTASAETPDRSLRGSTQISGSTTPNALPPVITSGSVVSSASLRPLMPIAPGALISIFGLNLADGMAESGVPRETVLRGTLAVLGGVALPLLYVSESQINAIVPYNIQSNTSLQLVVQSKNNLTIPLSIPVAPAQPAVFTLSQTGTGQGLIYSADAKLVDRNNPAKAGDTVVIYCAGLGGVDQPIFPGFPAPSGPLARTSNSVAVTIGGQPARVDFAGLAPGFTALYQVNAVVPGGLPPGDVDVVLTVAGQISPPGVTLAVR